MNIFEASFLSKKFILISGRRFGLLQTKVGLVSLLSKFQFNVCKKTPIPVVLDPKSFMMAVYGGMWLQIRERVK
jgi:cytochrome P450 family 6